MIDTLYEKLRPLGFSEHEVRAYLALLRFGPQTGYQLAKSSGIPRPNIYPLLQRIKKRGAITAIQQQSGIKYAALPAKEMLSRLASNFDEQLGDARKAFAQTALPPQPELVWNIEGYHAVLERARALAQSASHQLLAGVWSQESEQLQDVWLRARKKKVATSILCIQGCAQECGFCVGEIFRYPVPSAAAPRWLVVATDQKEILMAQIHPDGTAIGTHSSLRVLVSVGTYYLQNAIAVAEIIRSLGPRLRTILDAPAQKALRLSGLAAGEPSGFSGLATALGLKTKNKT